MPFKANQDRRHRIPKQRHRVTNSPAHEAGLRARGSLTVWFTPEAVAAWRVEPRATRGGQPRYSAPAITTALTLRAVFRLALRLWRRLGRRLALDWRLARGDGALPSAVVADSRSLRSAPTSWTRGINGGKPVKGVKLLAVCDKHSSPLTKSA